jgi:hypothetical protein
MDGKIDERTVEPDMQVVWCQLRKLTNLQMDRTDKQHLNIIILHYRKERMKRKYDFGVNKSSCGTP